jgi:hypothetical protein
MAYFGSKNPVSIEWNLNKFDGFVKEFIKKTEYDTASVVRYISREVAMRATARTPIGQTQRAAAGWSAAGRNLNFNVPSSSESESGDSTYSEVLSGQNPRVEFNNNVPYVIYLEYGWSRQAPLGMVRISIAEVRASGKLPALLAKSYEKRWNNIDADERYETQEQILSRGLGAVRNIVPSKRSIAAHLSAELRARRRGHRTSGALSRIQKSFMTR